MYFAWILLSLPITYSLWVSGKERQQLTTRGYLSSMCSHTRNEFITAFNLILRSLTSGLFSIRICGEARFTGSCDNAFEYSATAILRAILAFKASCWRQTRIAHHAAPAVAAVNIADTAAHIVDQGQEQIT